MEIEQAREQLNQILSRQEYQVYYEDNRSFLQILWEKARNWLAGKLNGLFFGMESATGMANAVLAALVITVLVVAGLAIFRAGRNARRTRAFREKKPFQGGVEKDWTYAAHLKEAALQETRGAYMPAVRHLFLALLLYFDEKEWIEAKTWKTNGEYYQELGRINAGMAGKFDQQARFFDEVVYGERQITREEYSNYHQQVLDWIEGGNAGEGK